MKIILALFLLLTLSLVDVDVHPDVVPEGLTYEGDGVFRKENFTLTVAGCDTVLRLSLGAVIEVGYFNKTLFCVM